MFKNAKEAKTISEAATIAAQEEWKRRYPEYLAHVINCIKKDIEKEASFGRTYLRAHISNVYIKDVKANLRAGGYKVSWFRDSRLRYKISW